MAISKIFTFIFLLLYLDEGKSIKCISCNSKDEKQCLDLFGFNYTGSSGSSIRLIDCADEASNRQFIEYFSNLMSVFGFPVDGNSKRTVQLASKQKKLQACQKVVINDESGQIVIRDCAVLSDIACDSLKTDVELFVSYCDNCDTDYCNYSSKSVTNWRVLVIVGVVNAILRHHLYVCHR